jgi:hypothetical protein
MGKVPVTGYDVLRSGNVYVTCSLKQRSVERNSIGTTKPKWILAFLRISRLSMSKISSLSEINDLDEVK